MNRNRKQEPKASKINKDQTTKRDKKEIEKITKYLENVEIRPVLINDVSYDERTDTFQVMLNDDSTGCELSFKKAKRKMREKKDINSEEYFETVPVEDILQILDYLAYDEEKSYKEFAPKDRKGHIYVYIKKVQNWVCEQYPKEVKEWNKKIRKQFKTITEVKK